MKQLILLVLPFLSLKLATAQSNPLFHQLWQFNINDTLSGPYFVSQQCRQLEDTSLVFITKQFEQAPAAGSKPIAYYFSKLNISGELVIDRKKLAMPSPSFYLLNTDITHDGSLLALFVKDRTGSPEQKTDSAYLVKYDTNLEMVWHRWISNQDSGGIAPCRVTGATALTDGRIVVGYNRRDRPRGPRELVSILSLFTCFTAFGDSVYTQELTEPILQIKKGSDSTFFIRVDFAFGSDEVSETFLHSSTDGRMLKHLFAILPSDIHLASNFALIPATQQFVAVTVPAWSNSRTFSMHITDALLNHQTTLSYYQVTLFDKNFGLRLFKDREEGLYAFQYQPSDFPVLRDTISFCRLDAGGNVVWSYKTAEAMTVVGGEVSDIIPLAGNDFILVITHAGGLRVQRMTVSTAIGAQTALANPFAKARPLGYGAPIQKDSCEFSVKVLSNPSTAGFTFIMQTNTSGPFFVSVSDVHGRLIERKQQIPPHGILQLGQGYRPGIYLVQFVQNGQTQVKRIIKQ
ncbi:MAG: T9SS type A sorting domain-containing protein [Chitinophagaceae bacterium]|nr:T9SS type A sorting domain-containing protein [Chitinophagaceae bacterium]